MNHEANVVGIDLRSPMIKCEQNEQFINSLQEINHEITNACMIMWATRIICLFNVQPKTSLLEINGEANKLGIIDDHLRQFVSISK